MANCITKHCETTSLEDNTGFWIQRPGDYRMYWMCSDCYEFVTKGIGKQSQIYKNAVRLEASLKLPSNSVKQTRMKVDLSNL